MTSTLYPPSGEPAPDTPGLLIALTPSEWMADALCAEIGDDLWYPEQGGNPTEAKRVCRVCDVRAECLEYALTHETGGRGAWGIWAGLTPAERQAELRRREATPKPGRPRRITPEKAAAIRARHAADPPISQEALAALHGVSRSSVAAILRNEKFQQVPA